MSPCETKAIGRKRVCCALLAGVFLSGLCPAVVRADFLIYKIPKTTMSFVLQGKVQVQRDRQVGYYHAGLKQNLNFPYADVEVFEVPTSTQQFFRRMAKVRDDADGQYQNAVWALKQGLLSEFYRGIEETLKVDPMHAAALNVKTLKARIEEELPEKPELEDELRGLVKNSSMKIARSKHFILLHDTSDKPARDASGRRLNTRSESRLALLEQVYESFLMLFFAQDVPLDVPHERMKVVLFQEFQDYDRFSRSLSPELASASGYWDPIRNVSVFYDHGTDEQIKELKLLSDEIKTQADEVKRLRTPEAFDLLRFANTLQLLVEIARENADIEVVSHEATHQLAGNTGLFPRHVRIPAWAHEGLATYFESPGEAGWSGIGAVNEQRLNWYRGLERDRKHSNIDFIVGDQIFKFAASHGAKLHGYGQAWALTHFLMEKHVVKCVEFYRRLGEMPPDVMLSPELLTSLFNQVFESERSGLDQEWRTHMNSLKPDFERIRDEATRD